MDDLAFRQLLSEPPMPGIFQDWHGLTLGNGMADYWPQIISGAAGLIGSVIGTVGTLYAQNSKRSDEIVRQRQALGFAIAAEIDAYLDLMDRRDWVSQAEYLMDVAKSGQVPKVDRWITEEEQSRDVFPIFTANLSNIGMLGPSCKELGKFYTSVIAIRTTVTEMQTGKYDNLSPAVWVELIQEEIDFWLETVVIGRRLTDQLRRL
ncbi:hypothetical protein ACQZ4X_13120 [Agrobacterium vitis]